MRRILIGLGLLASLSAVVIVGRKDPATVPGLVEPKPEPSDLGEAPESPIQWEGVDLEEVRAVLPNNRYWTVALPTTDPAVKAERAQHAEERNLLLGKVLSGNASGPEIHAYYDEQQRLNEDYVAFSRYVLGRYAGVLSERDTGLLDLARSMNEQRLAQLPDERLRAFARKAEQDRARAAWNHHRTEGDP